MPSAPDGPATGLAGPAQAAPPRPARLAGAAAPGRTAGGPGASAIAMSPDFVQLHYAIEALRSEERPVVLQFMSAGAGDGTSTVAAGFAAVAASERPGAVLLVCCAGAAHGAPPGTPSLVELSATGHPSVEAVWRDPDCPGVRRASLGVSAHPLMEIASGALRRLLIGLGERYATVVLDCAPATSPDTAALSRHCDGTVLVVRAGTTRVAAVDQARVAVERAGGHVVGVVLNRRRRALPPWLDRLL